MAWKDIPKNALKQEGSEEGKQEAIPGTIEVTVRVMGENGEWVERSVRTDSGVSIGTFDVSSRDGYLDCFDRLEQGIIQARNEASRETAEAFLKEVGKKRKTQRRQFGNAVWNRNWELSRFRLTGRFLGECAIRNIYGAEKWSKS